MQKNTNDLVRVVKYCGGPPLLFYDPSNNSNINITEATFADRRPLVFDNGHLIIIPSYTKGPDGITDEHRFLGEILHYNTYHSRIGLVSNLPDARYRHRNHELRRLFDPKFLVDGPYPRRYDPHSQENFQRPALESPPTSPIWEPQDRLRGSPDRPNALDHIHPHLPPTYYWPIGAPAPLAFPYNIGLPPPPYRLATQAKASWGQHDQPVAVHWNSDSGDDPRGTHFHRGPLRLLPPVLVPVELPGSAPGSNRAGATRAEAYVSSIPSPEFTGRLYPRVHLSDLRPPSPTGRVYERHDTRSSEPFSPIQRTIIDWLSAEDQHRIIVDRPWHERNIPELKDCSQHARNAYSVMMDAIDIKRVCPPPRDSSKHQRYEELFFRLWDLQNLAEKRFGIWKHVQFDLIDAKVDGVTAESLEQIEEEEEQAWEDLYDVTIQVVNDYVEMEHFLINYSPRWAGERTFAVLPQPVANPANHYNELPSSHDEPQTDEEGFAIFPFPGITDYEFDFVMRITQNFTQPADITFYGRKYKFTPWPKPAKVDKGKERAKSLSPGPSKRTSNEPESSVDGSSRTHIGGPSPPDAIANNKNATSDKVLEETKATQRRLYDAFLREGGYSSISLDNIDLPRISKRPKSSGAGIAVKSDTRTCCQPASLRSSPAGSSEESQETAIDRASNTSDTQYVERSLESLFAHVSDSFEDLDPFDGTGEI